MTNIEAAKILREKIKPCVGVLGEWAEAVDMAILALEAQTEFRIYDQEEIHHNCVVQVLTNSVTGDTSIGWWEEKDE